MATSVQLIRNVPAQRRVERRPAHDWWVKYRPYQIQPIFIAPVIPGETLVRAMFQCRAKTNALAADNSMLGWWCEHYVFYVRLTDLEGRDDFRSMLLQYGHDLSAYNAAANVQTYHAGPSVDWTKLCLDRVVEEYFRSEGDGTVTLDGLPQAGVQRENTWLDSAKLASATAPQDHELPGENPTIPDELSGAFSQHMAQWEHMRAMGLTSATYEDWLRAYGVTPPPDERTPEEDYHPELIRYSRDFQYPSVVVDGASGSSTAAVVWSIAERVDKKRFFREPGFIFGVTVARPKVYFSNQKGTGASMLNDAYAWLPAVLRDHPFTSLKAFDNDPAEGPLGALTSEPYWVDLRDLFIYGDQFVNFSLTGTPAGTVALPTASMQKRFAASADIDKLFADAAGGKNKVEQEGRIALDILGNQKDTT